MSNCAACGNDATGSKYGIHRDGDEQGPQVDLCNDCGSGATPTCDELWKTIRKRQGRLHKRRILYHRKRWA